MYDTMLTHEDKDCKVAWLARVLLPLSQCMLYYVLIKEQPMQARSNKRLRRLNGTLMELVGSPNHTRTSIARPHTNGHTEYIARRGVDRSCLLMESIEI